MRQKLLLIVAALFTAVVCFGCGGDEPRLGPDGSGITSEDAVGGPMMGLFPGENQCVSSTLVQAIGTAAYQAAYTGTQSDDDLWIDDVGGQTQICRAYIAWDNYEWDDYIGEAFWQGYTVCDQVYTGFPFVFDASNAFVFEQSRDRALLAIQRPGTYNTICDTFKNPSNGMAIYVITFDEDPFGGQRRSVVITVNP